MDKDVLRLVIVATGLLVIAGMLLWSFMKNRKTKRKGRFGESGSLNHIDPSLALHPENDDFEIVPLGSALDDDEITVRRRWQHEDSEVEAADEDRAPEMPEPAGSANSHEQMPALIQFSLVAQTDEGFNGADLFNAFNIAGLEYGSLKIFERVDAERLVDFGVASMVEPGTFPDTGLEEFYSPGLVFFMQPREVDDAVAVFDDFVQTLDLMAVELGGLKRDHRRQPLTRETVLSIRNSLSH
ncbi:MAG: cell division protein ZipA C-terminal FtsZ-binding domain-containing protein [Gammaproteobacteria bacterium]